MMSIFHLPEMHCESCLRSVTTAIRALDPAATVSADFARREVSVQAEASDAALAEAMRDAGFDADKLPD